MKIPHNWERMKMKELKSKLWPTVIENIRKCHLSTISGEGVEQDKWITAFDDIFVALYEERKLHSAFAPELGFLTEDIGISYDIQEVLEEYFDMLEDNNRWDDVVASCEKLLTSFVWRKTKPSQYYFRKGNALLKSGKIEEAKVFGEKWLKDFPNDLFAAASNSFLLLELGKEEEAGELARKYLGDEYKDKSAKDSVYMAAVRLLELTNGPWAKDRVAKKIAEYEDIRNKSK